MNISQFVHSAIQEKMETEKLSDSQERFLSLFDIAYSKSYDPYFKQQMVVLNRIEYNTRVIMKQIDLFMGQFKIPQNKEDIKVSIIDHPITEIAHDKVLKDLRNMKSKKKELEDE